ncbi:DNA cytosine methyltransferase [Streptomyces sp. G7(2002)]|uniref:DNA cytosine methyltransferase n=1 Tax=Streptomyces sp. G7(2002) TaxID=2971798 RepID=UPI00237E4E3D|nr:DNA cytosine methyltransferase [Streptomyces sp. G7(2002)]WDT56065.1 DNA cytosine methyltransferase [Streptomyces sp. G7(2002)]
MHDAKIVDLFAGPGGLDVAARQLGLPAVGIEWDEDACATRRAAQLPTRQGDVRDFGPADFPKATVLAGGPPCQTYTVAGAGAGRRALDKVRALAKRMAIRDATVAADLADLANLANRNDPRTGLVLEPLRWALEAIDAGTPYETIVLEQVRAALPVWQAVREVLEGEKYSVACGVLHTEEFGVPQTRRRAILIARLNGEASLPRPTHRPYQKGRARDEGDPHLLPWVTMGEALARPGPFVVISNYGTGGNPKARGRRTSDEPAATVTGKIFRNRVVTPTDVELARFTPAEAGQLQTFPVDHQWTGRDIGQQIGNAIPPRLGIHVLATALDIGGEPLTKALHSLAKVSSTAHPHGEPVEPVLTVKGATTDKALTTP